MIFKYSVKKYFIFFILLFVFISEWVEAENRINQNIHEKLYNKTRDDSIGIKVKIPFDIFPFQGVKSLPPSVTIRVKSTEIELASVMQVMEKVTHSFHDNLPQVDFIFSHIRSIRNNLCKDKYFEHISVCNNEKVIRNFNMSLNAFRNDIEEQVSDRILYPSGHNLDKPYIANFFKRAIILLDANCIEACSNWNIAKAIRFTSQEKYHRLYNKIKTKDPVCQKNILEEFTKNLKNEEFPEECLQEKNKSHPVCESMLKDMAIIGNRFKELVELVYKPEVLHSTEANANCLECALQPNNIRNLNELIDILDEHNRCLDLNPEEEKTIYSGTGLNKPYTVKREVDGSYSFSLTLQFSTDKDYDGPVPTDQVPDYYMKKTRECIKQANEKMIGPKDERLKIVINSPKYNKPFCDESKINHILIGSSVQRDNNKKYSSDVDCPTINHQILDLLGLRDEHQKKHRGFYVHSETGNIESNSKMDSFQAAKLHDEGYRFQFDDDCRITTSNSITSKQDKK